MRSCSPRRAGQPAALLRRLCRLWGAGRVQARGAGRPRALRRAVRHQGTVAGARQSRQHARRHRARQRHQSGSGAAAHRQADEQGRGRAVPVSDLARTASTCSPSRCRASALNNLTPGAPRAMLDRSGIKNRVIVVSACHSGSFVPLLADATTLVIDRRACRPHLVRVRGQARVDLLRRRVLQPRAAPGALVRAGVRARRPADQPLGGEREARPLAAADRRRRGAPARLEQLVGLKSAPPE